VSGRPRRLPLSAPSHAEVRAALTAPGARFEMEEVEVLGATVRAWRNAPANLRAVLEMSRGHGDRVFITYEDTQLTFSDHYRQVAHLATILQDRYGVAKGDRVVILMRNLPEWSIAFWAAAAVGAVVVPLSGWWTGPELEYGLRDSGAKVVFLDQQRTDRLADVLPTLDCQAIIVCSQWGEVMGELPAEPVLPQVDIAPEDPATIFYTSGTTGRPKGALGTHRNICSNLFSQMYSGSCAQLRAGVEPGPPPEPPTRLLSVPLFHVSGCHAILVASLASGGRLVMMHHWDADRALELIERERVTGFGGVPTMVWQVLQSPSFYSRDVSSVQSISYGGSAAAPELVRRIEDLFPGRTLGIGYGLTETSSATTSNSGVDYVRKPDSVGLPVAVCDVRVVGPGGVDVPAGEIGELWIQGPNVVVGYWGKDEATAESFGDRWFKSGDLAKVDDEGFVYIVDRAKDMVVRGGENIYSVEVEAVLFEHPDVADAGVIGIPHRELGEEVGAVVVLRPDATTTALELQQHVARRLASFKVPAHIYLREGPMPRSPAGKLLKREIREDVVGTLAGQEPMPSVGLAGSRRSAAQPDRGHP
jgi:long-chain acyl-CoA synthetase